MKLLARRAVAAFVCAALLAAQWPAPAWAGAAAPNFVLAEPNAALAMDYLRSLGVYKDDADPLKSYLGTEDKLTAIGRTMYFSLKSRYNPREEVESMRPILERLRGYGAYSRERQNGSARAMKIFTDKFGKLEEPKIGNEEASFRLGGLREALMTGAAIADAPQGGAYWQREVQDGIEFRDAEGLAVKMTKNQVVIYNRELQKNQRKMNLSRPPQVAAVPETGRYNHQTLQYTYWRLKNQETEYLKATRVDRMVGLAELLGRQYPMDMWFNEKGLEEELIRAAKAKTYDHGGETYSVFDLVEAKFKQRRAYLEGVKTAVRRFEQDMNRFAASPAITDAQVATLALDEKNALRWLSLSVLEMQMFQAANQGERVDPAAPDAQAVMKIIDKSDMTLEQRVVYKEQGRRMKGRLDELKGILKKTRKVLEAADYMGSLDSATAALAATQKQLGELSVDYSIYLEAPSTAFLAKGQAARDGGYNPIAHLYNGISWLVRGAYGLTPGAERYEENMAAIAGGGKISSMEQRLTDIAALIAKGRRQDWSQARSLVMAMNPEAAQYAMSGTASEGPAKPTDSVRIVASLKANHARLNAVTETNKTLDAATMFVTWAVGVGLMAPVTRAALNLVGKLSVTGVSMINGGIALGGARGMTARVLGRSLMVVGETAKHAAARLESLEPSAGRVQAVAGENAAAQYLVASGARALSVGTRQATFTAMAGGISAGFTAGTHLWDMAFNRAGGVNVAGWQAVEPGHTMFSEDWDGLGRAAKTGFMGGAWWANESLDFGFFKVPTAAIGFVGLPSTVYGGTRMAGIMDVIGTRGVVGSASRGVRVMTNGSAAVEAAEVAGRGGFLARLSEAKWYTAKPLAAFGLSMADNVSKYMLFSQAAGWAGQKWGWWVDGYVPLVVPFVGVVNHPEENIERRIKRSNELGKAWLESPAWLLVPTYSAHGARDAGPYMRTAQGMRQYDEAGRTQEYANAPEGATLKLKAVKPPVSQRLFEARFFGEAPASEWIVTKQAKEMGRLKEVTRLAGEGGIINPIELMAVRDMVSGEAVFRTLHVTEEVQKTAYDVATDALVAQAERSLEALAMKPGEIVKGWGTITPDIQINIAKALYRAEANLGRTLTPRLSAKVREVLKDHLEANLPIGEAGKALREAVVDLAIEQPRLDRAQKEAIERVLDWEAAPAEGKPSYRELTSSLKLAAEAKLKAGELSAQEGKALVALYDYIIAGDARFNSFNRPEFVRARADVIFDALAVKFRERPEMLHLIDGYRKKIVQWSEEQIRKNLPADGALIPEALKATKLEAFIGRLESELTAQLEAFSGKLGPAESAALKAALRSVKTSAWVVRDAKGGPIPGWRAKQYVRLMQSFLGEGSHSKFVKSTAADFFEAMRAEHKGREQLLAVVDGIESDVNVWVKSREAAPQSKSGMSGLVARLEARLKGASGLPSEQGAALSGLVDAVAGLERQGLHKGILGYGRKGGDVQLFVKAPTSLGKTLLAYEGLLPYLEAEAAASKREVMFLTFNTKLQAQAEFDFLAYNKLGSEVKFETYEGLKTLIAEGKTKGRNVVEDYLMLQDEMDAAGQQPALTIGMVSGRVSRLSGQTTALNDSNAGLRWGMSRLKTIRVEAAEVQAQRIKTATEGLSDAHVERGRLARVKAAAEDVLAAVGELKRAKGSIAADWAEKAVEKGASALRGLVDGGGLPAAESEAAGTILAGLSRMQAALAERPADSPAVREQRASEMENAFLNQGRLMDLSDTVAGFSRLSAEARLARLALESKIENLRKDLARSEASRSPQAGRRADLLREQIELARVEKALVERFDGVDASARLTRLDEQIAAVRSGQAPAQRLTLNAKLSRLMRESVELETRGGPDLAARRAVVNGRLGQLLKSLGAIDAAALKAYRAQTARIMEFERENSGRETSKAKLRELETSLGAVKSTPRLNALLGEARKLEAGMTPERRAAHQEYRDLLERARALSADMAEVDAGGRAALESERASVRGRLRAIELDLSASPAQGDLGGLLRRLTLLSSQAGRRARKEEAALRREARAEIMKRFNDAGAEIVQLTREGAPGWHARVNRLLERRRALQEAYAGDESALYGAYREMKENARPLGEDARLTEKPYEIPGGEGLEPAAALKRADFLISRAREVEAAPKGGAGRLETRLRKSREEIAALSAAKESSEYFAAFDRMRKLELELLEADGFHTAARLLQRINGDSFLGFLPGMPKFLWQTLTGKLPSAATESMGLTRYHAGKMLEALSKDPMLPAYQRDNLMWSYLNSLLFPKGLMGRGSYVRTEIINMVQGFHDSAAGVRVDNRTGRFNVVHNGQWFESMDNASRRWWELEYGTDLTLPYTHNSMSTIKDVTMNKKSYFISLSGTSGAKFEKHLRDNKISIVGEGSAMPKNVRLELVATPEQRLARVAQALKTARTDSSDLVQLRPTDMIPDGAKKAIEEYRSSRGLKLEEPLVVRISEVPGEAARNWLEGIRATQENTSLIVLSVSDTRALRTVEARLKKAGVKKDEIAKVFADTEYLRLNVPEANVLRQMNIEGLTTGRVKILILDTRVGGRGLDLNFKGERNSTRTGAFRGYTNFEMLVLGPEEMSGVHMVQAMGRIDTGRTLNKAPRRFALLMDVETARAERVFRDMFESDPFFLEMRKDPAFQAYARTRGGGLDWNAVNDYVQARSSDQTAEGQLLFQRHEKAVRENLSRRNLEVEENLLRSSNVMTDAPLTQGKNPALERIR